MQFKNEEIIVRQGAKQLNLFFVNSGKVKLYYENEGHEILVNTLETGEIFGAMAFFEASIWTLSAASIGTTDLSVLKSEHLKEWQEDFPGLEAKLYEFSRDFEATDVFRSKSANDRRQYDRYPISGRVPAVLIDSEGKSIGVSSTVELTDISQGGISYLQRISQKENARFMLGRKAQILLPQGLKDTDVQYVVGDVLTVKPTYAVENDYSVHVRFNEPISKNLVLDVSVSVHR
jgi:CRP-like cAMP-binding protein